MELEISETENLFLCHTINHSSHYGGILMSKRHGDAVMKLHYQKSRPSIHFIFSIPLCSCHKLVKSLSYFFSSLERLFDPGYYPSEQDIIRCRARTIGITETTFSLRDHEMLMVDVGGQKSERRKWIHCFQDVTSILFLVSLSGYDQCLVEDRDAVRFSRYLSSLSLMKLNSLY